ncbi:MAG: hypothetical protein ABSD88_08815 [Candidatus Korobacteraceae bacterium]|jgi:hypothetical protein
MDRFEELAMTAKSPVIVIGNPERGYFELVPVSVDRSAIESMRSTYAARELCFRFLGVVGLVRGCAIPEFAESHSVADVEALSSAYAYHLAASMLKSKGLEPRYDA